jgi:hypothetical protein
MGMGPGIDLQNFFSVFCDVAELTVNPKNINQFWIERRWVSSWEMQKKEIWPLKLYSL